MYNHSNTCKRLPIYVYTYICMYMYIHMYIHIYKYVRSIISPLNYTYDARIECTTSGSWGLQLLLQQKELVAEVFQVLGPRQGRDMTYAQQVVGHMTET